MKFITCEFYCKSRENFSGENREENRSQENDNVSIIG